MTSTLPTPEAQGARPLCVDLDGTLIRSDTLIESAIELLRRQPWLIVAMLWWLFSMGKAGLKREIARRVSLDASLLPYRAEFIEWLQAQAALRPLYLATAAHQSVADAVATHLGLFAGVFATQEVNLSSRNKAQELTRAFGVRGFDYAGNSRDDLAVWSAAAGAVVVGAPPPVARLARQLGAVHAEFDPQAPLATRLRLWIKALRVYQWVKNLLVFLGPLAAHSIVQGPTLLRASAAFVAFSLAASAIYLINDLMDLRADRLHPRKRARPFAAGTLDMLHGVVVAGALLLAALAVSIWLGWAFVGVLVSYVVVTTLYSAWLKRQLFIDVAVLAWLYTVRVIGGTVACDLGLSFWLLSVCAYGFLSLALVKRFAELASMRQENREDASGRAYRVSDMPVVMALGVGAGLVASLVMALYVDSTISHVRYSQPQWLWPLFTIILIGIGRLWLLAGRGQMHDDPIVFVARDKVSMGLLAVAVVMVLMAI